MQFIKFTLLTLSCPARAPKAIGPRTTEAFHAVGHIGPTSATFGMFVIGLYGYCCLGHSIKSFTSIQNLVRVTSHSCKFSFISIIHNLLTAGSVEQRAGDRSDLQDSLRTVRTSLHGPSPNESSGLLFLSKSSTVRTTFFLFRSKKVTTAGHR